jgi:hypothetical protein
MICQSYWKPYHWQQSTTWMMVLCAVRDVLSNTRRDRCRGRGGAHCMASTLVRCESSGFLPVGHTLMQLLLTTKRHFTIAVWMPVRLSATAPPSLNGCGTPWLNVSRRAVEDILSTYYKCTLSAITQVDVDFFLYVELTKFVCTFQVHPIQLDLPEVIYLHISS